VLDDASELHTPGLISIGDFCDSSNKLSATVFARRSDGALLFMGRDLAAKDIYETDWISQFEDAILPVEPAYFRLQSSGPGPMHQALTEQHALDASFSLPVQIVGGTVDADEIEDGAEALDAWNAQLLAVCRGEETAEIEFSFHECGRGCMDQKLADLLGLQNWASDLH
jgi:hypothetical protein